jgi:hypothetical protein
MPRECICVEIGYNGDSGYTNRDIFARKNSLEALVYPREEYLWGDGQDNNPKTGGLSQPARS